MFQGKQVAAVFAVLWLTAMSGPAYGSGFLIYEMSGAAIGKGSAVAGEASEPAALWYNPGAMAFLPAFSASAGVVVAAGTSEFTPEGGGPTDATVAKTYYLPRLFVDARVTDWLHAGLGVYSIYGMGVRWENDWQGRAFAISADMATVSFNPAISIRLSDQLGLGAGFVALKGSADLTTGLPEPVGGDVRFGADGWAYGGHAGLLYRAVPDYLHVGLAWRSRLVLPLEGRADFDPAPEFARELLDQAASTEVTMPDIFTLGLFFQPLPGLSFGLDGNMILWNTYDETVLDLDDGSSIPTTHDYNASIIARIGAEWHPGFLDGLALRGGFIYDQNPAPENGISPTMPDAEKFDFTAGAGYRAGLFRADASYMYMVYLPAEIDRGKNSPLGEFNTGGHLAALTLSIVAGE